MDPDENIKQQLDLAARILKCGIEISTEDGEELAGLIIALDTWLLTGGALPKRWRRSTRK